MLKRRGWRAVAGVLAAALVAALPWSGAVAPVAADTDFAPVSEAGELALLIRHGASVQLSADITMGANMPLPDGGVIEWPGLVIGETNWAELDLGGYDLVIDMPAATDQPGAAIEIDSGQEFVLRDSVGGGSLTVMGSTGAAAIGSLPGSDAGTFVVYSGIVRARVAPGAPGAAIGGGLGGGGGALEVYGGTIEALGGNGSPGIGPAGSFYLEGGVVESEGGSPIWAVGGGTFGAGIDALAFTMDGGTVQATGGFGAPGIFARDSLLIRGGDVTAQGGQPIYDPANAQVVDGGAGLLSNGPDITGGIIEATGGASGPGIGGYSEGATLSIFGGDVTARAGGPGDGYGVRGGGGAAGIGGGPDGSGIWIEMWGGFLQAYGSFYDAYVGYPGGPSSGPVPGDGIDSGAAIGSGVNMAAPVVGGYITVFAQENPISDVTDGVAGVNSVAASLIWDTNNPPLRTATALFQGGIATVPGIYIGFDDEAPAPGPRAVASSGQVVPGDAIGLELDGFQPHETISIEIHSTPVHVGTVSAGATGHASAVIVVPSSLAPGAHTIVATGLTSGFVAQFALAVGLPATGDLSAPWFLIALLLGSAGLALVGIRHAGRARRSRTDRAG